MPPTVPRAHAHQLPQRRERGAYSYTVAGGTGVTKGVNQYALDYLLDANVDRTGVMMMDFPGARLISAIIAHNLRLARWSTDVESDAREMFQNIVAQSGGDAANRATVVERFRRLKVPSVHWNVGVVKNNNRYSIGTDPSHVLMHEESDDYRFFAYVSDETTATQNEANIQQVVAPSSMACQPTCKTRADLLRVVLQTSYPSTTWAVIVKQAPGGFENWSVLHYGSSYLTWRGDYVI